MSNYYRYFNKTSNFRPQAVSTDANLSALYGDEFVQNYPLTSSISVEFYPEAGNATFNQYTPQDTDRKRIKALKAILPKYSKYSVNFAYSSSVADFENDTICLVSIPSIFYGNSLEKGSVKLSIYKNGVLLSRAEDVRKNGELVITTGYVDEPYFITKAGNIAGLVLYDEGLITLFNTYPLSRPLDPYSEYFYSQTTTASATQDNPRWTNWGLSANLLTGAVVKTSFDIEFNGVNIIPQITMFAQAPRGDLNTSTNYTFITSSELSVDRYATSSYSVLEKNDYTIKNITKNLYVSPTASFHKETYITKINIYDEEKKLIGTAKLATPVRKNEQREYTFKLKLDL